jgi:hypothetical protein
MSFAHGFGALPCRQAVSTRRLALLLLVPAVLLLATCARQVESPAPPYAGAGEFAPRHYYPPPGPPGDPWGPYIREAAARYNVPEQWIRAVMQQESGGQEQAVSPVGAMGLMQVMPETYEGLRERYGLGPDPFDPHNNILAGAAYIREMYDRYGAPGFLAAYNAGPDRVDSYLAGASNLPHETRNYLAAVTPNLGGAVALSGPFATYAYAGGRGRRFAGGPSVASLAAGCDLNAAYDPNHPCSSLMRAATAPAAMQVAQQTVGAGGCDLSAAYDPDHPCTSVGTTTPAVSPAPVQVAAAQPAPMPIPTPVQSASAQRAMQPTLGAGGCDLSAAYDPDHPCTSAGTTAPVPSPAPVQIAAAQPAAQPTAAVAAPLQLAAAQTAAAGGGCNLDAAYDPSHPCTSAGRAVTAPAPPLPSPAPAPVLLAAAAPVVEDADPPPARHRPVPFVGADGGGAHVLALPAHDWAIQVGAFANPGLARAVAEGARAQAPGQLRAAALSLPPTSDGRGVLYRARLANLSASAAADACWQLNQRQLPCTVVQPRRS